MGIPMAISSVETIAARRTVNQNASQFISMLLHFNTTPYQCFSVSTLLRPQAEPVTGEQGSGLGAAQKIEELAGRILLFGSREHDGRLVQCGIGIERNRPIAAFVFKRGCKRMGERDQSRLGVTRFDELRGLRHVFSQDKPAGNLIV